MEAESRCKKEVTQREKLRDAGEVVKVSGRGFGTVQCLELAHYATKSIAKVPLDSPANYIPLAVQRLANETLI